MKSGRGGVISVVLLVVASGFAASEPPVAPVPPEAALVVVTCRTFTKAGAGNGFVIGDGTLVVTCNHVVMECSEQGGHRMETFAGVFSPYLGEACDARIVARDEGLDLAVLEVPWRGHPSLSLADANEILAARRARVIGLYTAVHRLGDWEAGVPASEIFQTGTEERPVAFIGVRKAQVRMVALNGIGQLGHGWSGSPMLLPGTSVAIGCFACIGRVMVRPNVVRDEGSGPAVSQVPGLLGEAIRARLAGPGPARRESPEDARTTCELALSAHDMVQRERYKSAPAFARAFVQRRPDSAFAHAMLAYASEHVGQVEAAREAYTRSLQLDPNNLHTQLLTAQFLGTQGDPNAALAILEPLWRSGRSHDVVGIALANLHSGRKEWARCQEILEEALQSHPQNAYLWQQMAACRMGMLGPQAALEPLARAVELYPECGPLRSGLAHLLESTGALDEAERHFRKLLEVEPENPVVYCWLAEFLDKHRPTLREETLRIAEKALALPARGSMPRERMERLIERIRGPAQSAVPE